MIQSGFSNFKIKLKIKFTKSILCDFQQIEEEFYSKKFYKELDDLYLAFGKKFEVEELYKYVENPFHFFKEKANEMKQTKIETHIMS